MQRAIMAWSTASISIGPRYAVLYRSPVHPHHLWWSAAEVHKFGRPEMNCRIFAGWRDQLEAPKSLSPANLVPALLGKILDAQRRDLARRIG